MVAPKLFHAADTARISVNEVELRLVSKVFASYSHWSWVDTIMFRYCQCRRDQPRHHSLYPKRRVSNSLATQVQHWLLAFSTGSISHRVDAASGTCPSKFIKSSIQKSPGYGGTIVKVLPIPLTLVYKVTENDSGITHAVIKSLLHTKATSNACTFVISFDSRSFVERKNPWAAIRAFIEAFPALEGLLQRHQLIVKTLSATIQKIRDMQTVIGSDARVVIVNDLLSDVEMEASEQLQDCHVSSHVSEGW